MIQIIKNLLKQIIDDIDSGNSNITEDEQLKIIDCIQSIQSKELTKLESADYIGVCRATFDNYIDKGLIPKGKKRQGAGLFWKKSDLDKFLKSKKKNE